MTSKINYDIFTSDDHEIRWLATYGLCGKVARYFDEQSRPDLQQDATIYVYGKLGKIKPNTDPLPYLETIAYRYMARNVHRWRKDGLSLDGQSSC